jgi:hypothetical protein
MQHVVAKAPTLFRTQAIRECARVTHAGRADDKMTRMARVEGVHLSSLAMRAA